MFAYGSGLASSMFRLIAVEPLLKNNTILTKLSQRIKLSPEEYSRRMQVREQDYQRKNFVPEDNLNELRPGTIFLERVDDKWRRFYNRKDDPKL